MHHENYFRAEYKAGKEFQRERRNKILFPVFVQVGNQEIHLFDLLQVFFFVNLYSFSGERQFPGNGQGLTHKSFGVDRERPPEQ